MTHETGINPLKEVLMSSTNTPLTVKAKRKSKTRTKWEYRIERPSGDWDSWAVALNALGEEGWEIVELVNNSSFVFKREKRDV